MTWGHPGFGGDSSQVHEQLRNVQSIQAPQGAFAAILESGAVVTWVMQELAETAARCESSSSKQLHPLLPVLNLGPL